MMIPLQRMRDFGKQLLIPAERSLKTELLDTDGHAPAELGENFRDICRVNQLLGGTSVILRHLPALVADIPQDQPVTILDLATGTADIPCAIVKWSRKQNRAVEIVASDVSEDILSLAREATRSHPEISLVRYDARSVPLPDKQYDIVLCSLSLHHFSPNDAILVLREMRRLAKVGIILNDLSRSRVGYVAAWIASRLTTRNRLTRHDAPLSVLRAYTPDELANLFRRAGYRSPRISRHLWFRMAAVEQGGVQ